MQCVTLNGVKGLNLVWGETVGTPAVCPTAMARFFTTFRMTGNVSVTLNEVKGLGLYVDVVQGVTTGRVSYRRPVLQQARFFLLAGLGVRMTVKVVCHPE